MNYLSWLSLLGNVTSGSAMMNSHAYLDIPSNAHIFHKYYSHHYYYVYKEQYSFRDKVWIFDGREKNQQIVKAPWLFHELFYDNKREFISDPYYLYRHEHKNFINWSVNKKGDSLKDILRVNLNNSQSLFAPFNKSIHLEYSRAQKGDIYEYVFYNDGNSDNNQYANINFGKLKESTTVLNNAVHLGSFETKCKDLRNDYLHSEYEFSQEEGYDGICDVINIQNQNVHFMYDEKDSHKWTTPYVSYKYINSKGWDEQYYYYSLGEWVSEKGMSLNLLKNSAKSAWRVDYDNVFALVYEGNKLHIKLNKESDVIKSLDIDQTENNPKLANFLLASSYLDFTLQFHHAGREVVQKFTIKDVLENKAFVDLFEGGNYFSSPFVLFAEPRSVSDVLFGHSNSQEQKYYYKVNVDNLQEQKILFDKLHFDISGTQDIFPSELLDSSKISKYFFFMDKNNNRTPISPQFLNGLYISGDVDDQTGTAHLTYKFNGQVHSIDLLHMKQVPNMLGQIYATDFKNAILQLKQSYSESSDYLWKNIYFSKRENLKWDNVRTSLYLYFNPKIENSYFNTISLKRKVNFDDLEVYLMNIKDIFPVQKIHPLKYQDLSELFEMNEYAASFNLGKENYTYTLVGDYHNSFDVLASLHVPSQQEHLVPESQRKKIYTFDKSKFSALNSLETTKASEGWFGNPSNIVIVGAGSVFAGSAIISLVKKIGWFKTKVI